MLEKLPFSEAGKGLFGKVRGFFGGMRDGNRRMDGITIKLKKSNCTLAVRFARSL